LLIFEELKPVGIPQVAVVVNDVAVQYELDPNEQTVCTRKSYAVPATSVVRSLEVVVIPLTVVHVEDDEGFHWRL
jgi:hypothetical protein